MSSKIIISSTTYSKEFLAAAWKSRDQLPEYARRGFGQFFYLTICSHIECVLQSKIKRRLISIRYFQDWDKLPLITYTENDAQRTCSPSPVIQSIRGMLQDYETRADAAPLSALKSMYNSLFDSTLEKTLGKDHWYDLDAIGDLRNLFAHGRDIFLELVELDKHKLGKGTLLNNPLSKAADRLLHAKIITSKDYNGNNHDQFRSKFFSDKALLYFYGAINQIEAKLNAHSNYPNESGMETYGSLPKLV